MSKRLKIVALAAAAMLVLAAVSLWSLYRASQQVPEFYSAAVSRDPKVQHVARDEFIADVTALASDLHGTGTWQRLFSADEINAWLALELTKNYPDVLDPRVRDPRISIHEQEATIACRFEDGGLTTVLSLTVEAYLAEPNLVALRVCRARAGALPVPLGQVLEGISQAAQQLKLRLEWRTTRGDPVALISFASLGDTQAPRLELTSVELREGELFVAGRTGAAGELAKVDADADRKPPETPVDQAAGDNQPRVGALPNETRQE
jgi:hypothetical protein